MDGTPAIPTPTRYLSELQHAAGNRAVGSLLRSRARVIARVLKDDVPVKDFLERLEVWKSKVEPKETQWHAIAGGVKDKAELAALQAEKIKDPREFFLDKAPAERKSQAKALGLPAFKLKDWMRVATWAPTAEEEPMYLLVYSVREGDVQLEDIVKRPGDDRKLGDRAHDELLRRARELRRDKVTLLADQPHLLTVYGRYGYAKDEVQTEGQKTRMTKTKLMDELKT